jgi:hypothetical protein
MQDKELYQHLLGLTAPWTVSEVKLDMQSQEIYLKVEHPWDKVLLSLLPEATVLLRFRLRAPVEASGPLAI